MQRLSCQLISLVVGISIVGCAAADGENGGDADPRADSAAGSSGGSNGHATASGGNPQSPSSSVADSSSHKGGAPSVGGASTDPGVPNPGGPPTAGGALASSGRTSPNPASTGGTSQTNGLLEVGGTAAKGGAATGGRAGTIRSGAAGTAGSGRTPGSGGTGAGPRSSVPGGSPGSGGTAASNNPPAVAGSVGALPKFVGNITTGNSVDPSGLNYAKYWDQLTPENAGKWGSVQSSTTSDFKWSSLDAFYKYAETNKIIFKQHTFVWGAQQPSGTPTLAQVETWIKSYCERYPNTKLIDVVNEPPPHTTPNYTANLGAGEAGKYPWITKAFKLARKYCGNAVLILNDYNNVELTGDRNHTVEIVKDIVANGASIDAIGCQSHGLKGASASTVQTNLAYMNSQTGLPIYITEFDIDNADDNGQLNSFKTFIPIFMDTKYVHGVTVWGWILGSTWEKNSGIVKGTAPRAAMTWLMDYLKRPSLGG